MRPSLAAIVPVAAALALASTPVFAHRLDEYLQGTILSVDKNRLEAQMTLTPGVAVFPLLISEIDRDADGVISEAEQQTYARNVLHDLSLSIDGHRLTPRLLAARFPAVSEMREGRGEIHLDFDADLTDGRGDRKLIIENHHHSPISAYQVNCLVPRDPGIRIVAQNRNYSQSFYELDFEQAGQSNWLSLAWLPGAPKSLGTVALLLLAWSALLWLRKSTCGISSAPQIAAKAEKPESPHTFDGPAEAAGGVTSTELMKPREDGERPTPSKPDPRHCR